MALLVPSAFLIILYLSYILFLI
ncbi:hypothetical protein GOM49_11945 [Clostridium bovifaecis]|uniref:Uncharacterized protein n=1 Tax=Clostridium bovifaecis TaxID=2184719 RepID=A0A6I6F2Q6_9CLOT|nr:hypothetical protein GOM49_11945 [Clostridium bovifaecis]